MALCFDLHRFGPNLNNKNGNNSLGRVELMDRFHKLVLDDSTCTTTLLRKQESQKRLLIAKESHYFSRCSSISVLDPKHQRDRFAWKVLLGHLSLREKRRPDSQWLTNITSRNFDLQLQQRHDWNLQPLHRALQYLLILWLKRKSRRRGLILWEGHWRLAIDWKSCWREGLLAC